MKTKLALLATAILVIAAGGYLALANPFKVTDPSNPRFDPDEFRFSDTQIDRIERSGAITTVHPK